MSIFTNILHDGSMKKSILLGSVALFAMATPHLALAQSASNTQKGDVPEVETIVVTGSRVISDIANSPTPLTVVTTEQLLATTPRSNNP